MATGYNLDDKGGLMAMFGGIKNASKVLKKDDVVEVKHYSSLDFFKASILEISENTLKIHSKDRLASENVFPGDPIVIQFSYFQELHVFSGEIESISQLNPLDAQIKISKIEKMKDLRKNQRYYVSIASEIKIVGISENVFAAVKNISFGGVKINCKVDILMEDIIDVTIKLDKTTKLQFKGRVVRKNKLGEIFEYGLEIHEIAESNLRNLHHYINQFEFGT